MSKRSVLVTGAAGGIGLAVCRRLGADSHVIVSDLTDDLVSTTVDSLRGAGLSASGHAADVSNAAEVRDLVAFAKNTGPLVCFVHLAAVSTSMADWRRLLEVDLVGTALVVDELRPLMGDGAVGVCVASTAGHMVQADESWLAALSNPLSPGLHERISAAVGDLIEVPGIAYSLAKLGVLLLVEAEAVAYASAKARLVSVSPGIVDTPLGRLEYNTMPVVKQLVDATPLGGRMSTPDEIAKAIEFLASPAADFITGCDLRVDGGLVVGTKAIADQALDDLVK